MTEAIARYFPAGTRMTRPTGGMCLWVQLPEDVTSLAVHQLALAAGIGIAPGSLFSAKQKFSNFIRLNRGNPWTDRIENAVRTLGRIISSLAGGKRAGPKSEAWLGIQLDSFEVPALLPVSDCVIEGVEFQTRVMHIELDYRVGENGTREL